jgi:hypothetical protein
MRDSNLGHRGFAAKATEKALTMVQATNVEFQAIIEDDQMAEIYAGGKQ